MQSEKGLGFFCESQNGGWAGAGSGLIREPSLMLGNGGKNLGPTACSVTIVLCSTAVTGPAPALPSAEPGEYSPALSPIVLIRRTKKKRRLCRIPGILQRCGESTANSSPHYSLIPRENAGEFLFFESNFPGGCRHRQENQIFLFPERPAFEGQGKNRQQPRGEF
jgi:hypothetical protein